MPVESIQNEYVSQDIGSKSCFEPELVQWIPKPLLNVAFRRKSKRPHSRTNYAKNRINQKHTTQDPRKPPFRTSQSISLPWYAVAVNTRGRLYPLIANREKAYDLAVSNTKAFLVADGAGHALAFWIEPGQAHELPLALPLLDRLLSVPRLIIADRGSSSTRFHQHIEETGQGPPSRPRPAKCQSTARTGSTLRATTSRGSGRD